MDFEAIGGSFRDPAGRVYNRDQKIYRTINKYYAVNWQLLKESGFLTKAIDKGLLIPYKNTENFLNSWQAIEAEKIPFISYPYEWCFSQLKKAALHTLDLQVLALENNFSLKDSSVYNIQFKGNSSTFIDHLSFEPYLEDKPWIAYLQFCKHFLAPLALIKYRGLECSKFYTNWIDGFPLDLSSRLLPKRTYLSPFLAIHLHIHAWMQNKHSDGRQAAAKARSAKMSKKQLLNLCQSLKLSIEGLKLAKIKTQWGNYYQDTNYSAEASAEKAQLVEKIAATNPASLAVDLGANTGIYSKILAKYYDYVLAVDIDPLAVEKHYQDLSLAKNNNILPLVLDLANPSPNLGWAGEERDSFTKRCQADLIMGLALIHHLVMGAGIPMPLIAKYFADLLKNNGLLILEFVPKKDSQVERLLAAREDIFTDYSKENCLLAFSQYFSHQTEYKISGSLRTIHIFKKKD